MTEANNGKEEHHLALCTFCRVGLKIMFLLTAADHFSFYILSYIKLALNSTSYSSNKDAKIHFDNVLT